MKFTIDDKPAVHSTKPSSVIKAEEALRNLPDGKLLTILRLSELTRLNHFTLERQSAFFDESLCALRGRRKFYGNAKTVKAYKAAYQL